MCEVYVENTDIFVRPFYQSYINHLCARCACAFITNYLKIYADLLFKHIILLAVCCNALHLNINDFFFHYEPTFKCAIPNSFAK